jgi:hypothetical protein
MPGHERPTIDRGYRVLLNFYNGGVFMAQTHMDFRANPNPDWGPTFASDLVNEIGDELLANNIDDALGTAITIPDWVVQNFDDPTQADIHVASEFVGGEASNLLPNNVSAIASLRTDRRGRSFRGRAYWPGYTEASSVNNTFNATSQANLQAFYDEILGGIPIGLPVLSPCILSIKNAIATVITSVTVEGTWATQRRRLERARA